MTHVHVTEPTAKLTVQSGRLVALKGGEALGEWPLDQVRRVSCHGPISMSGPAAAALMDANIPVLYLTRRGRYRGQLLGDDTEAVIVRMAQYGRWQDRGWRLALARAVVRRKLEAQQRLLAKARRPEVIAEAERGLRGALAALESAPDVETVMGHEGAAARAYFGAFGALLTEDVPFNGRSRQPPLDPVNALLSLGYVMVGAELSGHLAAEGLDPSLGFLHGLRAGRQSLALDLLEPLRAPVVDRWVLTLFNLRQVQAGDFEAREDGGIYLNPAGLRKVLSLYEQHLGQDDRPGSWRRKFGQLAQGLREALVDGVPDLPPLGEEP